MIRFVFYLEDVHGSITRQEDGSYLLTLLEGDLTKEETKVITPFQAASILFASFDETCDEVDQIFDAAREAQKGLGIKIVP